VGERESKQPVVSERQNKGKNQKMQRDGSCEVVEKIVYLFIHTEKRGVLSIGKKRGKSRNAEGSEKGTKE